jgi:hypothetical protein
LTGAGFVSAGSYEVEEMPGLLMEGLVHPQQRVVAAVYEHPQVGVFLDLVSRNTEGHGWTFSNCPQDDHLAQPEWKTSVRDKAASPSQLLERLLEARRGDPWEVAPSDFAEFFRQAYAKEMDWRNARGGPSEEEVLAVARADGTDPDAETLALTKQALQAQAMRGLDVAFREAWERGGGTPEAMLFFVHDRMPRDYLIEQVSLYCSATEEDWPPGQPRSTFSAVNDGLDEGGRFVRLGEVGDPLPADVYRAPDGMDEDEEDDVV